ncbi:MAG: hypothetical protein IT548_03900 [Alphaproteobacteria bacterium]|nr:hypothetical protein [Alphaproteobacteria bacterium]
MVAKLKTYRAEIGGTHEWIVAARNQKEAAEIWGTDIDVFREGRGGPTTIPALVGAAMEEPGQPLRRVLGSKGPFKPIPKTNDLESWRLAVAAAGVDPNKKREKPKLVARQDAKSEPGRATPEPKPEPPPKPKLDRSALDAAEAALAAFESRSEAQLAALKAEMEAIAERHTALVRSVKAERAELAAKVKEAKRAFEKQAR